MTPYIYPLIEHREKTIPTPDEIINYVCKKFGFERKALKTTRRKRGVMPLPVIRQVCYYMLRKFTQFTYNRIGQEFTKDHVTVIHGIKCVQNMIDIKDRQFYPIIQQIETELKEMYQERINEY